MREIHLQPAVGKVVFSLAKARPGEVAAEHKHYDENSVANIERSYTVDEII